MNLAQVHPTSAVGRHGGHLDDLLRGGAGLLPA